MAAKSRQPNRNRLLLRRWMNGRGEDRLWDRDGRQWKPATEHLDVDRTSTLYFNHLVPVAVYDGATTLRWIDPPDREAAWEDLRHRTFDDSWSPPPGAPGTRPFEAQEWRSGDDSLLLLDDND